MELGFLTFELQSQVPVAELLVDLLIASEKVVTTSELRDVLQKYGLQSCQAAVVAVDRRSRVNVRGEKLLQLEVETRSEIALLFCQRKLVHVVRRVVQDEVFLP